MPVADDGALDAALARSHEGPVLLFNYDPGCGINGRAMRELDDLGIEIAIVDVRRHHALGQAVAARTGVRHESPQVLLLVDGEAVWTTSHGGITARAVGDALGRHA